MVLAWELDLLESSPCSLTGSWRNKVHPVSEPPQFPLVHNKQLWVDNSVARGQGFPTWVRKSGSPASSLPSCNVCVLTSFTIYFLLLFACFIFVKRYSFWNWHKTWMCILTNNKENAQGIPIPRPRKRALQHPEALGPVGPFPVQTLFARGNRCPDLSWLFRSFPSFFPPLFSFFQFCYLCLHF